MNLTYLFAQANPIPAHALVAGVSVLLGGWQLYAQKGDQMHRYLGYVWVLGMTYVCCSSFWIHTIHTFSVFSFLHVLTCLFLVCLYRGIRAAQQNNMATHQKTMQRLYWLGVVITSSFTFLPDRTMYQVFFR
jgi:uncharacterized membrane protein